MGIHHLEIGCTQTPSTRALVVEALQYILQINGKVVTDAITVVVRKEG